MVDYASPPPTSSAETTRKPPAPPKTCNRMRAGPHVPEGLKCLSPATHLFAVVDSGIGQSKRRMSGSLGQFVMTNGELKPGVDWVGWCARCPECLREDLEERANG
jgi:hypothetical protein